MISPIRVCSILKLLHLARSLARVTVRDPGFAALTSVAWLMLIGSRGAIKLLSLRRITSHLGSEMSETPIDAIPADQLRKARRTRRAISKAAPYTPTNSNCYPRGLTAHWLLRSAGIPSTFYYGAAFAEDTASLETHVWVRSGPVMVTGGPEHRNFAVVSAFAWVPANSTEEEKPVVLRPPEADG